MYNIIKQLLVFRRKEGDLEFMNIIVQQVANPVSALLPDLISALKNRWMKQTNLILYVTYFSQEKICFLTVGDEKGAGLFLLSGPEIFIKEVGPK